MSTGLADTYLSVQQADPQVDRSGLEATIAELARQGQEAWPGVEVEPSAWALYLAERAPDGEDPAEAIQGLHGVDLYLACACGRGQPKAIAHFEKSVLPAAEPAIARIDANPDFVNEVTHEVRVRLLVDGENGPARIRSYIGTGPLRSWVQVVAMRTAYGQKRIKPAAVPDDADRLAELPFDGLDAEMKQIREQLAVPFQRAFGEALSSLTARERNILRLHLLEGVNTETIGRMYQVHRATVARWIARTHEKLLSETRRGLTRQIGVVGKDLDSFMRLLQSQLEISIVSALR